jgi:hypothetical protein
MGCESRSRNRDNRVEIEPGRRVAEIGDRMTEKKGLGGADALERGNMLC